MAGISGIVAQNDELGQRICILVEFLQGKPVFESYKNLCKKIGDEAIEYKEFDFWFHRFANGKLDSNYDKSLEPETRSFSDTPIGIVENIVGYLDPMDRFIVRKVNRNLRTLVDNQHKRIVTIFDDTRVYIEFFDKSIEYVKEVDGCTVKCGEKRTKDSSSESDEIVNETGGRVIKCGGAEKKVDGGDYMEIAFNDLTSVLKISELQLNTWMFIVKSDETEFSSRCFGLLLKELNSLNRQFHVSEFTTLANKWEHFMPILPYLKAESLDLIAVEWRKVDENEEQQAISKIFETDQWKHATLAFIGALNAIPAKGLSHLTYAGFRLSPITALHIHQVVEMFRQLENLEFCWLETDSLTIGEIKNALGASVPNDPSIQHYQIPGTNEFLDIDIDVNKNRMKFDREL